MAGMHPELIHKIQRANGQKDQRLYANQRQRQIKNKTEKTTTGLAQRGAEVVFLTLVMHHVTCPKQVNFMADAVKPVVAEVVSDKGKQIDPKRISPQAPGRQMLENQHIHAELQRFIGNAHHLAHHAKVQ